MISNEKKQAIMSLGVHDLRNLARIWGVPRPTLMLKKDLIDGIIKAMELTDEPPELKKTSARKGRPAKQRMFQKFANEGIPELIKVIARQRLMHQSQIGGGAELVFHSPEIESELAMPKQKLGYVRRLNEVYYFYDKNSEDTIYLPLSFVLKYNIEVGDLVMVNASFARDGVYAVESIIEINGTNVVKKPFDRVLVSIDDVVIPKSPDKILDIVEGTKNYYQNLNGVDFIANNIGLINELKGENYIIKVVGVCLSNSDIYFVKNIINEDHTFLCSREHDPIISYERITDAIFNTLVSVREGKKVALIVLNLAEIKEEMERYYSLATEVEDKEIQLHVLQLMRKLVYSNKTLKNGGSLTSILISKEENCPDF